MGKCFTCGKEATHCYAYYSGSLLSKSAGQGETGPAKEDVAYKNMARHDEYLCKKCSHARKALTWITSALGALLLAALLIRAYASGGPEVNLGVMALVIVLFLLCGLLAYFALSGFVQDKRMDENEAAIRLIKQAEKHTLGIVYCTPREFERLNNL